MCTYIAVFRCGIRWHHSKPPNSGSHFWSFFTTLRKNSVANYGSIWTLFSPSVRGPDVLCNTLNISVEIFQNVKKWRKSSCQILPLVSIKIVINSTDGAQHFANAVVARSPIYLRGIPYFMPRLLLHRRKPMVNPNIRYLRPICQFTHSVSRNYIMLCSKISRSYFCNQQFVTFHCLLPTYLRKQYCAPLPVSKFSNDIINKE